MPIYEYKCDKCGGIYEIIQSFSDKPQTTHADCGGEVHRLVSAPSLQFKGTGWYITDYAKGSGKPGGSKSESAKGDGGKGESRGDSKGESKSESGKSESGKSDSKPAASSSSADKK